jgi:hypothetical protein
MHRVLLLGTVLTIVAGFATPAAAWLIQTVGPGQEFPTLSAAAGAQTPGHLYQWNVVPGTYLNDFPVITEPTDIEAQGPVSVVATVPNDQGIITTYATLIVNGLDDLRCPHLAGCR